MNLDSDRTRDILRSLLKAAQEVRSRILVNDRRLRLRDVYSLSYYLAIELRGQFPDVRIMVGDREDEHGFVQHHWIEIPSVKVFLDPAGDALDPFHPVRVGKTSDQEFTATYRNGVDSNIDVTDPRNRPDLLFKTKSAWDSEV
jgi:hypothetical protein